MMNKQELIKAVAKKNSSTLTNESIRKIINDILCTIEDCLAHGERVDLLNFGSFRVSDREAKRVNNPRTGEPVYIPSRKVPVFKPGKRLREAVDN